MSAYTRETYKFPEPNQLVELTVFGRNGEGHPAETELTHDHGGVRAYVIQEYSDNFDAEEFAIAALSGAASAWNAEFDDDRSLLLAFWFLNGVYDGSYQLSWKSAEEIRHEIMDNAEIQVNGCSESQVLSLAELIRHKINACDKQD